MNQHTVYVRNLFFSWFALAINLLAVFFVTPFVIDSLGNNFYGIWLIINSIIGYMGLTELGINVSTGRYVNFYLGQRDYKKAAGALSSSVYFYLFVAILCLPAASLIAPYCVDVFQLNITVDEFYYALLFTVLSFLFNVSAANLRVRLLSEDRFDLIAICEVSNVLIRTFMVLVVFKTDLSLISLSISTFTGSLCAFFLSVFLSIRWGVKIGVNYKKVSLATIKALLVFGGWALVSNAGVLIINYSDNFIIGLLINTAAIVPYSLGFTLINYFSSLIIKINAIRIPFITKTIGGNNHELLQRELESNLNYSSILGIPAIGSFFFMADDFFYLWMGKEFLSSATIAVVLAMPLVGTMTVQGIGASIWAKGYVKALGIAKLISAVVNVVLSCALLYLTDLSIVGVAIASAVVMLLEIHIWLPFLAKNYLQITYRSMLKTFANMYLQLLIILGILELVELELAIGWYNFIIKSATLFIFGLIIVVLFNKINKIFGWKPLEFKQCTPILGQEISNAK